MQYASRPGNSTSFFQLPKNGASVKDVPQIPAFLDGKNDRVYAFQNGNTRLCSWHALQGGGPDGDSALKVDLKHPALSISLLPMNRGVMYGSCADGSVYIAQVVQDSFKKDSFAVEYLSSKPPKRAHLVGTVAEILGGQKGSSGKKRKASDSEIKLSLIIYQIFFQDSSFTLVRHDVACGAESSQALLLDTTHEMKTSHIPLPPNPDKEQNKWRIDKAKLLVSSSGASSSKIAVAYRLYEDKPSMNCNSDLKQRLYCVSISLDSVCLAHNPVQLPATIQQVELVMENVLVAGTMDEILLYDLQSGIPIKSISVTDLTGAAKGVDWLLCADSKLSLLAVIYPKDDHVHAAFATTCLEGSAIPLNSSKLTLADRMSSSLAQTSRESYSESQDDVRQGNRSFVLGPSTQAETLGINMEQSVHIALDSLRAARDRILDSQEKIGKTFLLESYEKAVAVLLRDIAQYNSSIKPSVKALRSARKTSNLNGLNPWKTKRPVLLKALPRNPAEKEVGGNPSTSRPLKGAATPAFLPQSFVDGSVTIALSVLLLGDSRDETTARRILDAKFDARLIFSRLIHTGKVSARLHLEGGSTAPGTSGSHYLTSILQASDLPHLTGRKGFSPVEMMHEILRCCPDVSESQLVVMLDFMLCRSLPDDAAHFFARAALPRLHAGKLLSKRFFGFGKELRNSAAQTIDASNTPLELGELSKVSSKLILVSASFLLHHILLYSQCNESILRSALNEGLSRKEVALVAGLLSDLLAPALSLEAIATNSQIQNRAKVACQWIAALCEGRRDELAGSITLKGTNRLSIVHRALVGAVAQCEAILSLQEEVKSLPLGSRAVIAEKRKEPGRKKAPKKETGEDELPGYTIDCLVF
jgi:hypothetical protein